MMTRCLFDSIEGAFFMKALHLLLTTCIYKYKI